MSSLALTQKERNAMMEQIYGGFQKNPTYTEAAGVDSSDMEYSHGRAGQVDFYAYGGDARDIGDSEDFYMAKHHDRWKNYGQDHPIEGHTYGDRWRNRDTWKKVKDHLGIDRLDSKDELRQMYDFVQGYQTQEAKEDPATTPATEPLTPNTDRPDKVKQDQQRFEETRLDRPQNQMPRLEDAFKGTQAAAMGSIRGGDDLNEWYQTKFVPHLEADANATSSEIGDDSRYFLDKFVFDPPKLGSVKEIFDRYKGEIEDLD